MILPLGVASEGIPDRGEAHMGLLLAPRMGGLLPAPSTGGLCKGSAHLIGQDPQHLTTKQLHSVPFWVFVVSLLPRGEQSRSVGDC